MNKFICFLKNIRFLCKINLKEELANRLEMDLLVEQLKHELPELQNNNPNILSHDETVEFLINSHCSLARFGDGEIEIISGNDIPFQKYNSILADRLKKVLLSDEPNFILGINYEYFYAQDVKKMTPVCKKFYRNDVSLYRKKLAPFIISDKNYCSSGFTQLYQMYEEYSFEDHFNNLKKIWNEKNILLVGNDNAFQHLKYNIYDNANNIDYLSIPSKNAFDKYDEILEQIKAYSNDTIVILMAGPSAKILSYDLHKLGYRALDLGHLAKDYYWYKKKIERNKQNIMKFVMSD